MASDDMWNFATHFESQHRPRFVSRFSFVTCRISVSELLVLLGRCTEPILSLSSLQFWNSSRHHLIIPSLCFSERHTAPPKLLMFCCFCWLDWIKLRNFCKIFVMENLRAIWELSFEGLAEFGNIITPLWSSSVASDESLLLNCGDLWSNVLRVLHHQLLANRGYGLRIWAALVDWIRLSWGI